MVLSSSVWNRRPLAALLLAAGLVLSGCSGSSPSYSSSASMEAPAAAPAQPADYAAAQSRAIAQEGGMPAGSTTNAALARKMIASASLSMVVDDVEQTVDEVEALMDEVGGYISGENLYDAGTSDTPVLQGNLELRVPAEALQTTLDRLEELALEIGTRTLEREDVTDRYSDVDAQLRNLEATETELREMLEEVRDRPDATPDDILTVHYRITEVRGQIEVLQGQKNLLDNLIGLSTISLGLAPDRAALPVVEQGWQPGDTARTAARTLINTLQQLGDALIWLVIVVLPVLLLMLLPIVVLILLVNWFARRRRAQRGIAIGQSGG